MTQSQWLDLMTRLQCAENFKTYQLLQAYYNQSNRHYHNEKHIHATLEHLQHVHTLADNYQAIEIALWFHDAIYNIFSAKNEINSAYLATDFLMKNNVDDVVISTVYNLIMATCHNATLVDNDECLIADIDLTILGSSREVYQQFETDVRKEYRFIPMFMYQKKRKQLLTGFLQQERIYKHDYFYQQLENSAQDNLSWAIEQL